MATKPLTSEAIALAETKMDMTLDDIIKMSKSKANAAKPKKQRVLNKSQRFLGGNQDNTQRMQQYMNSRSTLRQGVLAQKRSGFPNSFPVVSEATRMAAAIPFRGRAFSHNRAANWSKPRAGGSLRQQQGNLTNGGNASKAPNSWGALTKTKPKTLDSLFANMKQRRMRSFTPPNNAAGIRRGGGGGRVGSVRNQVMHPWLRRRFGNYQR